MAGMETENDCQQRRFLPSWHIWWTHSALFLQMRLVFRFCVNSWQISFIFVLCLFYDDSIVYLINDILQFIRIPCTMLIWITVGSHAMKKIQIIKKNWIKLFLPIVIFLLEKNDKNNDMVFMILEKIYSAPYLSTKLRIFSAYSNKNKFDMRFL